MRMLRRFLTRLAAFATRRNADDRVREEFEQHLAMQTADNIRAGLPPDEARRRAMVKFGSLDSVAARCRDEHSLPVLEVVVQDVRHTLRQLRNAPAFTLAAVLTLALGVGVNTTMFTVIHSVLLEELPYPEPGRLMRLMQAHNNGDVTIREYQFVKEHSRAFATVAAYRGAGERRIGSPENPHWINALVVSADFLRTLGVQPQIGREFTFSDTQPGTPLVVMLSDAVWRNVFGADPAIAGRTIAVNDTSATVIGVLPASFWFPQAADALLPLRPTGSLSDTGTNTQMIARLAPGVALSQAQAELAAMTEPLRDTAHGSLPRTYRGLAPLAFRDWLVGDVRVNLLLVFAATGILLLIACGNLALLLLTRFAARAKEVALRTALGSSPFRMLMQFLTENLLLTAVGATAGVAAAYALVRIFVSLSPFALPASGPIQVNGSVLAFTVVTTLATAVFVTLAPLLGIRRVNIPTLLRSEGKNAAAGAIRARTRSAFIVGEVALSTTLLVAAGLLVQTLYRTNQEQLGFMTDDVLTLVTPLSPERAKNPADRLTFVRALLERLESTPGVVAAAATNLLPLTGQSNLPAERDGYPDQSIGGMEVRAVTGDYFAVMGMAMLRGRPISAGDSERSAPVVVINETVARRWWADAVALGDRLTIGRFQGKLLVEDVSREVIGVVRDTKSMTLQGPPRPTVYVPMTAPFGSSFIAWALKTDGRRDIAVQIRAAVSAVDPAQRVTALRRLDDIVAAASARPRFNASLFALFAGVALVLTIVGLYGVLSFMVAQRRHEIGTRMALGASRAAVLRAFVREGLSLTAIGLVLGLTAAFFVVQSLSNLLFGVQAHDVPSFAGVALLVLFVGCAASYLPARRAATLGPLIALRAE